MLRANSSSIMEEEHEPFLHSPAVASRHPPPPPPRTPPATKPILLLSLTLLLIPILLFFPSRASPPAPQSPPSSTALQRVSLSNGNWTLHPPPGGLTPAAMAATCASLTPSSHHSYYHSPANFIDPVPLSSSSRTLSYIPSPSAGLGEQLLEILTSFALAAGEDRHFSISAPWQFSPVSATPENSLPCPRSANRLSLAHETRKWWAGHAFHEEFDDPRKQGVERKREAFEMTREGWEGLITEMVDVEEVDRRVRELRGGGVKEVWHLRRGAYKPKTWDWRKGVVPVQAFGDAGRHVAWVSDDPEVVVGGGAVRVLEGTDGLRKGGWTRWDGITDEEKTEMGRRFLLEVAVAAEVAEKVKCQGGSATCRLLAVGMGWEKAVEAGGWEDVDGGFGWKGIDW